MGVYKTNHPFIRINTIVITDTVMSTFNIIIFDLLKTILLKPSQFGIEKLK